MAEEVDGEKEKLGLWAGDGAVAAMRKMRDGEEEREGDGESGGGGWGGREERVGEKTSVRGGWSLQKSVGACVKSRR